MSLALRTTAMLVCAPLAVSSTARAQARPIRLETTGPLPFTAEELEQVVGARLAMSSQEAAALVTVGPADATGVHLQRGGWTAVVPVGARTGLAAARLVALAIAELSVEAEPGVPDDPFDTSVAPAAAPAARAMREAAVERRAPVTEPPRATTERPSSLTEPPGPTTERASPLPVRLGVAVEVNKGTDASEPFTWGFATDVCWPRRKFDLTAAIGVWDVPTRHAERVDETSFMAGVARLGVGFRAGPMQVALGPFVAPYRLEGSVNRIGMLAGGGALLRISHALTTSKVELFASLRLDAFVNRVSVSLEGAAPAFATPRLSGGVGLGMAWPLEL